MFHTQFSSSSSERIKLRILQRFTSNILVIKSLTLVALFLLINKTFVSTVRNVYCLLSNFVYRISNCYNNNIKHKSKSFINLAFLYYIHKKRFYQLQNDSETCV